MRKTFDEQLELLSQELTHMGALCETAIASATEALKNRDVIWRSMPLPQTRRSTSRSGRLSGCA